MALLIMDSGDESKLDEAEHALLRQIAVIREVRDPAEMSEEAKYGWAELNYEALNNLARLKNLKSDIEGSL